MPRDPLEPRKHPSQERSRELVGWILESAARVFDRGGYEAATTNAIAELAGVSIGSLYQYFPSKEAIVAELTRQHLESATLALRGAFPLVLPGDDLATSLRRLVAVAVEVNDSEHLHVVLSERSALTESARQAYDALVAETIASVQAILEGHGVGGDSPSRRARLLVVATLAAVHDGILREPRGPRREAATDEWVALLLTGLAPDS